MKRVAQHLSPATVIATIALFVALGGVSYGVATGSIDTREIKNNDVRTHDLRNNSIRTQDLRNNEVRGIDIRNGTIRARDVALGTLTGSQVNEGKLGKVPNAADADRLGGIPAGEYAAAKPEAVRLVGASGQPVFGEGFTADAAPSLAPGFWKDSFGTVHLQGTVDNASPAPATSETIFTLPPGYRPAGTARHAVVGGSIAIDSAGTVGLEASGAEASLDGITFRAAN